MKVIIVEREKHVLRRVIRIIQTIDSSIQILHVVNDFDALLKKALNQPFPDLVLINQQLLGHKKHPVEAKLTITTKNNLITYLAFRVNSLKQLQKKIPETTQGFQQIQFPEMSYSKLTLAMKTTANPVILQQDVKRRFLVTYQQKLVSIATEEIAYFFSDNRFIFFKTFDNRRFLIEYRMDELETILDPQLFFRINRSYIISITSITAIYAYLGNRCKIILKPAVEKELIVSRERFGDFKKWLGE